MSLCNYLTSLFLTIDPAPNTKQNQISTWSHYHTYVQYTMHTLTVSPWVDHPSEFWRRTPNALSLNRRISQGSSKDHKVQSTMSLRSPVHYCFQSGTQFVHWKTKICHTNCALTQTCRSQNSNYTPWFEISSLVQLLLSVQIRLPVWNYSSTRYATYMYTYVKCKTCGSIQLGQSGKGARDEVGVRDMNSLTKHVHVTGATRVSK